MAAVAAVSHSCRRTMHSCRAELEPLRAVLRALCVDLIEAARHDSLPRLQLAAKRAAALLDGK